MPEFRLLLALVSKIFSAEWRIIERAGYVK